MSCVPVAFNALAFLEHSQICRGSSCWQCLPVCWLLILDQMVQVPSWRLQEGSGHLLG